jgi:hypothetical protein
MTGDREEDRALPGSPGYGWSFMWLAVAVVLIVLDADPAHTVGAILASLIMCARTEILRAIAKVAWAA